MQRILLISAALGAATLSCGGSNGIPTANAPDPAADTAALTTTLPATTTTTFSTPTIAAALPTLAPITTPNAATPTIAAPLPTFSPITTTVAAPTTAAPLLTLPPITITTTVAAPAGLPPGVPYTDWVTVTDDSQLISVSVPASWAEVDGRMWGSTLATGNDELIGPGLSASPDITAYVSSWSTPGMFIGASAMIGLTPAEMIDEYDFTNACTFAGRYDYDDGLYLGVYDEYVDCGDAGSEMYQIVAAPQPQTWIASVQIQIVTEADREAASQIIGTWQVQELAG